METTMSCCNPVKTPAGTSAGPRSSAGRNSATPDQASRGGPAADSIEIPPNRTNTCCTGAKPGQHHGNDTTSDHHAVVSDYYSRVLGKTTDLKTSACATSSAPHPIIRAAIAQVPQAVKDKYYGCGSAVPLGIQGLHVLDLGSGSGLDCYVAAALVGREGSVTGIDMTDGQLAVARDNIDEYAKQIGYQPNMTFVKGFIEDLATAGLADSHFDLVISNCVVNLSPDKLAVLRSVYRVLKPGGEFYFSDVYADRRLPVDMTKKYPVLLGECIAGALYVDDFRRACSQVGFREPPRIVAASEIVVTDQGLKNAVGKARFWSITYRLFKSGTLEDRPEDYGQLATYKGTLSGYQHSYCLDVDTPEFFTGKPALVSGNTAAVLQESWLARHFDVMGDRRVHYGPFQDHFRSMRGMPGIEEVASQSAGASKSGGNCCG